MTTITINGISYSGNNIVVTSGKVKVNGKDVTPENAKEITISVTGNIKQLKVDACNKVSVDGHVDSIETMSGDVDVIGSIFGSISTMSGDIECSNVGGSVSTMSGNIKHIRQ